MGEPHAHSPVHMHRHTHCSPGSGGHTHVHTHMHTHSPIPGALRLEEAGSQLSCFASAAPTALRCPPPLLPTAARSVSLLPPAPGAQRPWEPRRQGKQKEGRQKAQLAQMEAGCTWTQSTRAASGQSGGVAREGGRGRASMGGRRGPPRRGITGVPGGAGEPGRAPWTPPRAQPQAGHSEAWPGSGPQTPPPELPPKNTRLDVLRAGQP